MRRVFPSAKRGTGTRLDCEPARRGGDAEIGIDISQKPGQEVFDVWKSGPVFAYVITVCHESEAGGCPIFPGPAKRLHWPFPDPSKVEGGQSEKLAQVREIRDMIRAQVQEWCASVCAPAEEKA